MHTIRTRQKADPDGRIVVEITDAKAGEEYDVVFMLSGPETRPSPKTEKDWASFVRKLAGSCPELEEPSDAPPSAMEPL